MIVAVSVARTFRSRVVAVSVMFRLIFRVGRVLFCRLRSRCGRRVCRRHRCCIASRFIGRAYPIALPVDVGDAEEALVDLIAAGGDQLILVLFSIVLFFDVRVDKADGIDAGNEFHPVGHQDDKKDRHEHVEDDAEVTAAGDAADETHQAFKEHLKQVIEAARRHFVAVFGTTPRYIDNEEAAIQPIR